MVKKITKTGIEARTPSSATVDRNGSAPLLKRESKTKMRTYNKWGQFLLQETLVGRRRGTDGKKEDHSFVLLWRR
jgi:hypothetical protein